LRLAKTDAGYTRQGTFESAVTDLGETPPKKVSLDWLAQWTVPQTWTKHADNPVYGPKQSGSWDNWTNGVSVIPTDEGRRYRMYYCGRQGAGIGFAEADASQPTVWKEHPSSPVLTPRTDNWEGNLLNQPRVVKVTETHWRMYYTGWGFEGLGTRWAMGLAESHDAGITWQRVQDEPILDRGDRDSPDGAGACVPMVLRVGDQWKMWYTAGQYSQRGNLNIHLCLAESEDGIHWTKYKGNPVFGDQFAESEKRNVTSRCYVRLEHGVYQMWYSWAKPRYRIYYAESLDGIHWERGPVAPVLSPSAKPSWDDQIVEYPEIQRYKDTWRMWFCGNGYGTVGFAEGQPETDLRLSHRNGPTAVPDSRWSEWTAASRNQPAPTGRYLQVRASFRSANPLLSPALNSVTISPG
ncbi:MAG: hypothetical protein KDA79_00005, partial [Planctomycetaceae bacterium]|nr:hypothetical protein [Planctomycetaceae bacterium]